jgi:hypothetical protein
MSVSLTILKKNNDLNLKNFLETYISALNDLYDNKKLENYLYRNGFGAIGIVIEGAVEKENSPDMFLVETINILGRKFSLIKIKHQNSKASRKAVLNKLTFLEKVRTGFVVLEHTALHDDLVKRPPRLTSDGNIYCPVGEITPYFDIAFKNERPQRDRKGYEFSKQLGGDDVVAATDLYYSSFIDNGDLDQIVESSVTGLKHFTTVIHKNEEKVNLSFVQNIINAARYFFDPDIVFCSNEAILEYVVKSCYPEHDISVKSSLRKFTLQI